MRRIPLRNAACGGVLSLFTAFGYFGNISDNSIVIEEVARVLTSGGNWFLDYLDCDIVRAELSRHPEGLRRIRDLGPCRFTETRRLHPDGTMVIKDVEISALPGQQAAARDYGILASGIKYSEQVALFSVAELDELAQVYGLVRVAAVGNYDGAPLGSGDRWLLVYGKSGVPSQED